MGYIPLCGSRDKYSSYAIIQRGDIVIAIYESTHDRDRIRGLTYEEIWQVIYDLRTLGQLPEVKDGS